MHRVDASPTDWLQALMSVPIWSIELRPWEPDDTMQPISEATEVKQVDLVIEPLEGSSEGTSYERVLRIYADYGAGFATQQAYWQELAIYPACGWLVEPQIFSI